MTLSGPQKIPFAVTSGSSWYQDTYLGDAMEVNVGVMHTTEGTTLPDYSGGSVAPNVTGVPNIAAKTIKWYQHFDVDRSSRALVNASGGVQTNTLNCFQIELVGTCDPTHRASWSGARAGTDYLYWPDAPDWALAEVAKLVKWLKDNHNIPAKSTVTFKAYPGSYGTSNGVRLSNSAWLNYYGWLGHQHVPENVHGDPGDIDMTRILALANGSVEEEDVALSADDISKVADAVFTKLAGAGGVLENSDLDRIWQRDVIPAAVPPYNNPDYFGPDGKTVANPTWTATYAQYTQIMNTREAVARIKAVEDKVNAISVGGVDLDALAAKVADLLAARLAS